MKNLLFIIYLCFGIQTAVQAFGIRGFVDGARDGAKVYLYVQGSLDAVALDSAVVKNGRFLIRHPGRLEFPLQCRLEINNTPDEVNRMKQELKFYTCWIDNTEMILECPIGDMPDFREGSAKMANVRFTGSPTQDLYIEFIRAMQSMNKSLSEIGPAFIRTHRASVVSLSLAATILSLERSRLTLEEIDELSVGFDVTLEKAPLMGKMRKAAADARAVAKGIKYHDIELTTLDGRKVLLSEYVKSGQYNMLEFWASYCGPCRAEIPHLKQLRQEYGDQTLHIISISTEMKPESWKKAVREEGMDWPQLCNLKAKDNPVAQVYRIQGIPFCLVLDPEGKIVFGGNVRGKELDVQLKKLLGHL